MFAKAKTLISASFDEPETNSNIQNKNVSSHNKLAPSMSSGALVQNNSLSNLLVKELLSANQHQGLINSHTSYFKKMRDQTIGRYVIQMNKILITLDRLTTFDLALVNNEIKRDGNLIILYGKQTVTN